MRFAVLFGSFARGSANDDSDIDLAVDLGGEDDLALARDLSLALGREIDVVDVSRATIPLLAGIVRDGIILYEARPGLAATWWARTLAMLATDLPWFERMRRAYIAHLAGG